ncbi:hypothetical protein PIB30_082306 [Stylosanthes scabra]|uniref:Uncharacterized protein n=1 Tax=Stylosanthes scabra TaxID=79078 RepID=A0ABU6XQL8_9FABA|nr:hypothetical protein [Stylosanthes scabra]
MSNTLFALLFTLLLSTHVFTHEIPKGNEQSDENERKSFNYPTDADSEGLEGLTSDSSASYQTKEFQRTIPSMKHKAQKDYDYYGYGYYSPNNNNYQLDGLTFRINIPGIAKVTLPNLPIELPFPNLFKNVETPYYNERMNIPASNYYQPNNIQSFGYQQPSSFEHTENFEDGSIIRNRKVMRPSNKDFYNGRW